MERQVESLVADMVAARQRLQQDSLKCRALANAIRAVLGVPLVDTGASWVPSLHVCMQAPVRVLVMPCRASRLFVPVAVSADASDDRGQLATLATLSKVSCRAVRRCDPLAARGGHGRHEYRPAAQTHTHVVVLRDVQDLLARVSHVKSLVDKARELLACLAVPDDHAPASVRDLMAIHRTLLACAAVRLDSFGGDASDDVGDWGEVADEPFEVGLLIDCWRRCGVDAFRNNVGCCGHIATHRDGVCARVRVASSEVGPERQVRLCPSRVLLLARRVCVLARMCIVDSLLPSIVWLVAPLLTPRCCRQRSLTRVV